MQPSAKRTRAGEQVTTSGASAFSPTAHDAGATLDALRAAFVSALPDIAVATGAVSERAATLNRDFAHFVATNPPIGELEKGCQQYLEYSAPQQDAQQDAAASCGLEVPCNQFLDYLRELRPACAAGAPADALAERNGPPWTIMVDAVRWRSASDAKSTETDLRARAVIDRTACWAPRSASLELRGAPVDAHDNDTISSEAARALAGGLSACKGTLTALALTDMKLSIDTLRTLLSPLTGSALLRRLDLSSLCSRWTGTNTLGAERGALLSEMIRGWPQLEAIVLTDCTLAEGCAPVAAAIGGLAALKEVDLRFNEFDDAAALMLAESLKGKPKLESVRLDASDFGAEGLAAIRGALRKGVLRLSRT